MRPISVIQARKQVMQLKKSPTGPIKPHGSLKTAHRAKNCRTPLKMKRRILISNNSARKNQPFHDTANKGELKMDNDRVKGIAKQAKGAIKDAAGKLLGDAKLQTEGKKDKFS